MDLKIGDVVYNLEFNWIGKISDIYIDNKKTIVCVGNHKDLPQMWLKTTKCINLTCENHTHEGKFVGELCGPCYQYIKNGQYNNLNRNSDSNTIDYKLVHETLFITIKGNRKISSIQLNYE